VDDACRTSDEPRPRGSASSNSLRRHRIEIDLCPGLGSRRAGGRSTIANLGAAASPQSTDAAGGVCRPSNASRPPSRAVRLPRKSSPRDRLQTAVRPSSGSVPARSDPHGRGVAGAWSPTRDQRRSWPRDDPSRGALGHARSIRRWLHRQRVVRCGRRLHPIARVSPIPLASPRSIRASLVQIARSNWSDQTHGYAATPWPATYGERQDHRMVGKNGRIAASP
jgi:hypothetical protein